jgi:hypothetical protein
MYNNTTTYPNNHNVVGGTMKEIHPPDSTNLNCYYNEGDDLEKAALAHIAYNNDETKWNLLKHFDHKTCKLYRSIEPIEKAKDNCSRDLLILFLTAVALTMSEKDLEYYAKNLSKWRISKRFNMTPSLWFWVRFLATGNKRYADKFFWWFNLETKPAQWWTLKLCKWYNVKQYDGDSDYIPQKMSGVKKWLFATTNNSFAFHLSCWQLYVLEKQGQLKPYINYYMRTYLLEMDISNYLCFDLLRTQSIRSSKVVKSILNHRVNNYAPRNDFRWQRFPFNEMCDKYLIKLQPEQMVANTLDKDILTAIK